MTKDDDPTIVTVDTTGPLTDEDSHVLGVLLRHAPTAITVTTIGADADWEDYERWLETGVLPAEA